MRSSEGALPGSIGSTMIRSIAERRGFTLIEMIIVAVLITLLSGIAIFSISTAYDLNVQKVAIGESSQLATALSMAQQQLQFYPRLNHLDKPLSLILTPDDPEPLIDRIDYFGFLDTNAQRVTGGPSLFTRIRDKWGGPYIGSSPSRAGANRGSRSGFIKMRLPDLPDDVEPVNWPGDNFGGPWLVYQLRHADNDPGTEVDGEFIERENEEADLLNAVVSYGRNHVPGGNHFSRADILSILRNGALFIEGDTVTGGDADFTLRTFTAPAGEELSNDNVGLLLNVLVTLKFATPDFNTGAVGMLDDGNDDIIHIIP